MYNSIIDIMWYAISNVMLMGPWSAMLRSSPLLLLLPHLDKYITVELVNSSVVGHSSLSLHGVMPAWWCKLWHIVKLTLWCACWFMQIVTYSDALDCGIVQNTSFDLRYDAQYCETHSVMHNIIMWCMWWYKPHPYWYKPRLYFDMCIIANSNWGWYMIWAKVEK